jgi:hypothetical protein
VDIPGKQPPLSTKPLISEAFEVADFGGLTVLCDHAAGSPIERATIELSISKEIRFIFAP